MGDLGIDPIHRDHVEDILDGQTEPDSYSFTRPDSIESEWELEAIIDRDGEEHTPGEGGVDMVELHLPVMRLLEETRLRHDLQRYEKFRCSECDVSVHDSEWMARHLHGEHGLDDPRSADSVLQVVWHGDGEKRPEMRHPAHSENATYSA
jgi:hypothetical protein